MGWYFKVSSAIAGAVIATAIVAIPAAADSCTERQQVCFSYCQKTESNSPPCLAACRGYLAECMSTGCWESRVSGKRCGFDRR